KDSIHTVSSRGISMKSIQSEDGDWYTHAEFEILGGYEKSRNWRLSLRCYDRPLKFLIQVFSHSNKKINQQPKAQSSSGPSHTFPPSNKTYTQKILPQRKIICLWDDNASGEEGPGRCVL
ncbi:hypothetical protein STEG23_009633, partial [Scotinomys teguina]